MLRIHFFSVPHRIKGLRVCVLCACVRACVRVCAIHMRCSGIELSVKPSLVDSAEVQRVSVLVDGDKMTAGEVEVISTLQIQQVLIRTRIPAYTVC